MTRAAYFRERYRRLREENMCREEWEQLGVKRKDKYQQPESTEKVERLMAIAERLSRPKGRLA